MRYLSLVLFFVAFCNAAPVPEDPPPPKISPWGIDMREEFFVVKHNGVPLETVCLYKVPIKFYHLEPGLETLKDVQHYDEQKVTRACLYDPDVRSAVECVAVLVFHSTTPGSFLEKKLEREATHGDAFARHVILEVYRLRESLVPHCVK